MVLAGLVVTLWILSLADGETTDDQSAPPNSEQRSSEDSGQPEQSQESEEIPTTSVTQEPGQSGETPTRSVSQEAGQSGSGSGVSSGADAAVVTPQQQPLGLLQGRLVYLSGRDVVVFDLASGDLARVPIRASGSITPITDHELLTDRNRTVSLSLGSDPPDALLIASAAKLVPSAQPFLDYWVVSRPNGPDGFVRLAVWHDYGFMSLGLEAPAGSELLLDPDMGLLVISPGGGTYLATYRGFERVSEHRLLGSRNGVRVEQRCDEQLDCAVTVTDVRTDTIMELPTDFVSELSEISVSPDGRWVLNDTNPAKLFDRYTGGVHVLEVGGHGQVLWAEDSASVAWLNSGRRPTLVISEVRPAGGEAKWLAVELSDLQADPSPGSSFLLDMQPGFN